MDNIDKMDCDCPEGKCSWIEEETSTESRLECGMFTDPNRISEWQRQFWYREWP